MELNIEFVVIIKNRDNYGSIEITSLENFDQVYQYILQGCKHVIMPEVAKYLDKYRTLRFESVLSLLTLDADEIRNEESRLAAAKELVEEGDRIHELVHVVTDQFRFGEVKSSNRFRTQNAFRIGIIKMNNFRRMIRDAQEELQLHMHLHHGFLPHLDQMRCNMQSQVEQDTSLWVRIEHRYESTMQDYVNHRDERHRLALVATLRNMAHELREFADNYQRQLNMMLETAKQQMAYVEPLIRYNHVSSIEVARQKADFFMKMASAVADPAFTLHVLTHFEAIVIREENVT